MSLRGLVAASLMLAACTGSDGTALTPQSQGATTTAVLPEPVRFHCSLDGACPEVLIDGDSFATLGTGPSPFRAATAIPAWGQTPTACSGSPIRGWSW